MTKKTYFIKASSLGLAAIFISSCASVDANSVRPRLEIPSQALVEQISISYDQTLPFFLLAVDRVELSTGRYLSKRNWNSKTQDRYSRKDSNNETKDTNDKSHRTVSGDVNEKGYVLEREDREVEGSIKHGVKGEINTTYTETSDSDDKKVVKTTGGYLRNDSRATTREGDSKYESASFELAPETDKIRAQLTSALAGVENFKIVRKEDDFGRLDLSGIKAGSNKKGPYIVRAVITEYGTTVGSHRTKTELGLYHSKSSETTYVVGLDVEIRDPKTSRVIAAFPVHSAYGESELKRGAGFILGASATDMKRSGLDQALRLALNDAASKAFQSFQRGR